MARSFTSFASTTSVVASGDIEAALNTGTSVHVITGADPSFLHAGDITIASGTTIDKTAGGDVTLTLSALNHITGNGGGRIASAAGRLSVDFNSNSDAVGAGAISLSGLQILTNGGAVRFYGGSDPVNGRAQGDSSTLHGISLSETLIDTVPAAGGAAGDVTLRGRGGSLPLAAFQIAGDGVALFGGASIVTGSTSVSTNAGTGNVSIDGIAGPGVGEAATDLGGETTRVVSTSGTISIAGVGGTPGSGFGSGGDGVRMNSAARRAEVRKSARCRAASTSAAPVKPVVRGSQAPRERRASAAAPAGRAGPEGRGVTAGRAWCWTA